MQNFYYAIATSSDNKSEEINLVRPTNQLKGYGALASASSPSQPTIASRRRLRSRQDGNSQPYPHDFSDEISSEQRSSSSSVSSQTDGESASGPPMNHATTVQPAHNPDPGHSPNSNAAHLVSNLTIEQEERLSRSTNSSAGQNAKRRASREPEGERRTPPASVTPAPTTTTYAGLKGQGRSPKHGRSTSKNLGYHSRVNSLNYAQMHAQVQQQFAAEQFTPKKFGQRTDSGYVSRQNTFPNQNAWDNNANAAKSASGLLPGLDPRKQIINPTPKGPKYENILLQPESVAITQEQLAAEVKGIYAGLVMVEAKCINIDAEQANNPSTTLGPEQWQALIALHRTLLYEHHDFLMATQHPAANPALKNLASKYCMPARMWKHGIHAFLEVLRHRRPQSQEYMLTFIYLAYQMMDLLFETVPSFLDTWIECLGDLARYRMAIEEDKEVHATWGSVAARWYTMAADRHPQIGRLYHHLGILEKPSLRKFYFYARSLTSTIPFLNARESLGTLCAPILQDDQAIRCGSHSAEAMTICFHARVFSSQPQDIIERDGRDALNLLMKQTSGKIASYGVALAVTNIAALFEYGLPDNIMRSLFAEALARDAKKAQPTVQRGTELVPQPAEAAGEVKSTYPSEFVIDFYATCFNSLIRRELDQATIRDLMQYVHINLVWFSSLLDLRVGLTSAAHVDFVNRLLSAISWADLAIFLNALAQIDPINYRIEDLALKGAFILPERPAERRPLVEDYQIRGIVWVENYLSPDLFQFMEDDDGSRALETPGRLHLRAERVEWLACCIAQPHRQSGMLYDRASRRFSARPLDTVTAVDTKVKVELLPRDSVPVSPRSMQSTNTLSRPSSATGDFEMVSAPSDTRSINSRTELLSTSNKWQNPSVSAMTATSREAVTGSPERRHLSKQHVTDVEIATPEGVS